MRSTQRPEPLLFKAAELERLVPAAVHVDAGADHDQVVADLADRFDTVLDHLDALGDWSLAWAHPGKLILGSLGGIESGVRQLIRSQPLEVQEIDVDGAPLVVPTAEETLRIKAWLMVTRNQTRDHLDVAALAEHVGPDRAAQVLVGMDDYYADVYTGPEPLATQLVRQLGEPAPRDVRTTRELRSYKQLDARYHEWSAVVAILRDLARRMVAS
jgi:hypothetical protein